MTLIEGIGDEVIQFLVALLVVIIVSLAWWTTSISEQRNIQTVWLLGSGRSRIARRLTNHTHSVTIAAGDLDPVESASITPVEGTSRVEVVPKPPESAAGTSSAESSTSEERIEEDERNQIVVTMDANDTLLVRQRRLDFYDTPLRSGDNIIYEEVPSSSDIQFITEYTEDPSIMEHNYAEAPSNSSSEATAVPDANPTPKDTSEIKIKLKYINDDLKLVDGKLQELLGDFKKRHFHEEFASDKLVRLIFNGQVLHQDTTTLEGCGFFHNCVVHCLIHQRRPSPEDPSPESRGSSSSFMNNRNVAQNNNNQGREWDLGNFMFAIISFILISAWYFRYVYAHLYTVTATVGLILMTGVFTIILSGFYFPDADPFTPPRVNVAAHDQL